MPDSVLIPAPVNTTARSDWLSMSRNVEISPSLIRTLPRSSEAEDGRLQVGQVPWDNEASFRLPAATWKGLMDLYYPNSAWLCLRKDVFDRLARYKSRQGLPDWNQTLERLLAAAEGAVTS